MHAHEDNRVALGSLREPETNPSVAPSDEAAAGMKLPGRGFSQISPIEKQPFCPRAN